MTMTRRDFEAIADAVALRSDSQKEANRVAEIIAPALKQQSGLTPNGNRRFDEDRFVTAVQRNV